MDFFSPHFPSNRIPTGEELATGNTCAHQTEKFLPPSLTSFLLRSHLCSVAKLPLHFWPLWPTLLSSSSSHFVFVLCLARLPFVPNQDLRVCLSPLFSFTFPLIVSFPFQYSFIYCALFLAFSINLNLPFATVPPVLHPTPSVSLHSST